jgi:hypothetical protein
MAPEIPPSASGVAFAVETDQRLSRSLLWKLQRRYYDQTGIDAWRNDAVPHYATTNTRVADGYAEVFVGSLRDRGGASRPGGPVTLVELGAGSGRFAYLFLKAFTAMRGRSAAADVPFRYAMTDFTETNVRYWREHPRLRPFVDQGLLDFALLDAEDVGGEVRLVEAGVALRAGDVGNPLVVVANYVLDTVPQDAFRFRVLVYRRRSAEIWRDLQRGFRSAVD